MSHDLAEKCSALLNQAVEEHFVSGASLLLLQNGKKILSCQAGYRDLEQQLPMERDTIFRLYSMSKPVTGATAMILLERGLLTW